jgi:3-deoxy-7-phosphoheptulonate synthase
VAPLAFAAIAAGADGLIVEVHPDPECALSDGDQSLAPAAFAELMRRLRPFADAAGRSLADSVAESDGGLPTAVRAAGPGAAA